MSCTISAARDLIIYIGRPRKRFEHYEFVFKCSQMNDHSNFRALVYALIYMAVTTDTLAMMNRTLCLSNKVDVVVTEDKTSKLHYELFWLNLYVAI